MHILTFLYFFLHFSGLALGQDCRQCWGTKTITFKTVVTEAQAVGFLEFSLFYCATGNQYDILSAKQDGKTWTFDIKVWRYCIDNASVYQDSSHRCAGDLCSESDITKLTCGAKVHCGNPPQKCYYFYCGN